jgi:putative membrane protein
MEGRRIAQAGRLTPDFAALNPGYYSEQIRVVGRSGGTMIKNFSDHSANERTFLAWVRTSIAVIAFGFIVVKFDLFLEAIAPQLARRMLSVPGQRVGSIFGLALVALGTAMVSLAVSRFVINMKRIDSADLEPGAGSRIDVVLAVLLFLVGCALFIYLSLAVATTE